MLNSNKSKFKIIFYNNIRLESYKIKNGKLTKTIEYKQLRFKIRDKRRLN